MIKIIKMIVGIAITMIGNKVGAIKKMNNIASCSAQYILIIVSTGH